MKIVSYSILAIAAGLTITSCAQKIVPADTTSNSGQAAAHYNTNTAGNEATPQVQSYSKQSAVQTTSSSAPQASEVKEIRINK